MPYYFVCYFILLFALSACETAPVKPSVSEKQQKPLQESADPSRYQHQNDFTPLKKLNADEIADAVPRIEPIKAAGNKSPYMVFGKVYHIMPSAAGYRERGKASWYGAKFHGHKTSNGEIYDVSGMTAAHKTLPIPSYVKVTNVANNRSAIVRVNDRGPFHGERIIDLSYAAATKLGYINQGVAEVIVEIIDVPQWLAQQSAPATQPAAQTPVNKVPVVNESAPVLLQIGAYTQEASAQAMQQRLLAKFNWPVSIEAGVDQFYRLRMGPVQESEIAQISQQLLAMGLPAPLKVKP